MLLELSGIRISLVNPSDIARFKGLGYAEITETAKPVEIQAETVAVDSPAEIEELTLPAKKRGRKVKHDKTD